MMVGMECGTTPLKGRMPRRFTQRLLFAGGVLGELKHEDCVIVCWSLAYQAMSPAHLAKATIGNVVRSFDEKGKRYLMKLHEKIYTIHRYPQTHIIPF